MAPSEKAKRLASNHPALKRKAEQLADELRRQAEPHRDTGALIDSIGVVERKRTDGITEQVVVIDRENIIPIEYGHWAGKGENLVWVDGLGIVRRSLDNVRGGS